MLPLQTAEQLCDANKVRTLFSHPGFYTLARRKCFHPMYKWYVYKYYRIAGSTNQMSSDWICLRNWDLENQVSICSDHIKMLLCFVRGFFGGVVFDICVMFASIFYFINLQCKQLCDRWMKTTYKRACLCVSAAYQNFNTKGQHSEQHTVGLWWAVYNLWSACTMLKLAWPLNIIRLAWTVLLTHMLTLMLCKKEGSRYTDYKHTHTRAHAHSHTESHTFFPRWVAKINTKHTTLILFAWFDVSLRFSREDNGSLSSVMLGHTHAHAYKQMLANDANTLEALVHTLVKLRLLLLVI